MLVRWLGFFHSFFIFRDKFLFLLLVSPTLFCLNVTGIFSLHGDDLVQDHGSDAADEVGRVDADHNPDTERIERLQR